MLADPFPLLLKLKTQTFKRISGWALYPILGRRTPGQGVPEPWVVVPTLPHTCCVTLSQTLNHPAPSFSSLKERWWCLCAFVLRVMRELQGDRKESALGHWQAVGLNFFCCCPLLIYCMPNTLLCASLGGPLLVSFLLHLTFPAPWAQFSYHLAHETFPDPTSQTCCLSLQALPRAPQAFLTLLYTLTRKPQASQGWRPSFTSLSIVRKQEVFVQWIHW